MNFDTPEGLAQLGVIMGLLRAKKGDDTGGLLMNFANTQEQIKSRKQQQEMMQQRMAMEAAERQKRDAAEQQRQAAIAKLAETNPQLAPLLQLNPEEGVRRAFPEQKLQFAPNGQVVDMRSLQPGQSFAKQPDWKDPAYQQFQMAKAKAGASRVNVETRQETEFGKALGKQQGETYADLMKSDAMASSNLNKLSRLESLLQSSGNTGKLTPAVVELKAAAESLGFKVDPRLPFQQAAQALSNEIALGLRNPAGGAGMPGALSDRDREFLQNMVPNLAKTPEGNRMLIQTMKKLAQREKEIAKLAREYRKKTGRFDEGFYDALAEYSAKNPLFDSGPSNDGWSIEPVKEN